MNKKHSQKGNKEDMKDKNLAEEQLETTNESTQSDAAQQEADGCGCGCDCGQVEDSEVVLLKKKVENLEADLFKQKDDFLRRAADLDNYRKRMEKETEERIKYANQSVVSDFLPVLDNLELTLMHAEDGSPLKQGIELTIKSFKDTLAKYNMKEIDSSVGAKFDPSLHDAMMMDNNPDYDDNVITLSVQKGYKLGDRVVRHAKVKVNKK